MPDARPSFSSLLGKTITRIRSRGPREVIALGVGRLREGISSVDELILYSGPAASGRAPSPPEGVEVRLATPKDGETYARDIGTDSPWTFRNRLSDATRCFVVLEGDRIVHSTWVTTAAAWTRELKRYLRPPAGDAYIYESFTRSEVRGRGIYPLALAHISDTMAGAGITRLWVGVEADNPSSIRSITKAGFSEAFRVPYRRRWGRVSIGPPVGPRAEIAHVFIRTNP